MCVASEGFKTVPDPDPSAGVIPLELVSNEPRPERHEVARLRAALARETAERLRLENMLEESRCELEQLFETMPHIFWMARPDGWHTHFNQRWLDYTGLTLEESLGHGWNPPFHPDERPLAAKLWKEATESGNPYQIEYRLRGADGNYRWMLGRALPLHDSSGRIVKWFGTCTDIQDLKEAEESMRQKDLLIRMAGRVTQTAGWAVDLRDGRLSWTDEVFDILGVPRGETPPLSSAAELYLEPGRSQLVAAIERCAEEGVPFDLESEIRTPGGRPMWVRVVAEPERDASGAIVRVAGAFQDISERKASERALRESENELRALAESMPQMVWTTDPEGEMVYANQRWVDYTGLAVEESAGHGWLVRIHPDDREGVFDAWRRTLAGEQDYYLEYRIADASGEYRWMLARAVPFLDEGGHLIKWMGTCTDIHDLKKASAAHKQLEAQFFRAQRLESIGTLAGGIAHDFNNLLAPIVMGVSLLRRGETRPTHLAMIENMERSANRGKELVRQVLSFARGVDGERVAIRLHHIMSEVDSIVAGTFPKSVSLEQSIAPALWPIVGDPTQLTQVLINLCVNAADAMPEGGKLRLSARHESVATERTVVTGNLVPGDYVVVEVEDEGCGMPPEVLDRVFEPFFTTKPHGKGTGLGLSTLLGIVRSHGGSVQVVSEVGRGSRFTVYLPAQPYAAPASPDEQSPETLPRGNGETILVVDDELAIRSVTAQTLESFGYRPLLAVNGRDALTLYERHASDIAAVLTDMMMPVMDGAALIAALREQAPDLPLIAASGLTDESSVSEVEHFLAKPYEAEKLLELLARLT